MRGFYFVSRKQNDNITFMNDEISYKIKKRKNTKKFKISVLQDATVLVSVPLKMPTEIIEKFIFTNKEWILEKIKYFNKKGPIINIKTKKSDYQKNKISAYNLVMKKLEDFNNFYGYKYNNVTIRNQKTRWGSCSKRGNLNFNYKIIFLPEYLVDYIVVHELCHLGEFNHSKNFWNLVSKTVPNYNKLNKELRRYGLNFE
jgi:predicted metal-dependent hydrolase